MVMVMVTVTAILLLLPCEGGLSARKIIKSRLVSKYHFIYNSSPRQSKKIGSTHLPAHQPPTQGKRIPRHAASVLAGRGTVSARAGLIGVRRWSTVVATLGPALRGWIGTAGVPNAGRGLWRVAAVLLLVRRHSSVLLLVRRRASVLLLVRRRTSVLLLVVRGRAAIWLLLLLVRRVVGRVAIGLVVLRWGRAAIMRLAAEGGRLLVRRVGRGAVRWRVVRGSRVLLLRPLAMRAMGVQPRQHTC